MPDTAFSMIDKVQVLEALGYKCVKRDVYEEMRLAGRTWLHKGPPVYYQVVIDGKTHKLNEVFRYELIKATFGQEIADKMTLNTANSK